MGGGSTPLVLREGKKRNITIQGGLEGGCNSKHYWLMELLLDCKNYFNRFFD